jgi:hypothetical protein
VGEDPEDVEEGIRKPLAALRAADLAAIEVVRRSSWSSP